VIHDCVNFGFGGGDAPLGVAIGGFAHSDLI
jgi:hypothetical protein